MNNKCKNVLTVAGNDEEISKFKRIAKNGDSELSLNNLFRMPQELWDYDHPSNDEKFRKTFGAPNWVQWKMKYWGTCSDITWDENATLVCGENDLVYCFETLLKHPGAWLQAVSKKFPKLKFALSYHSVSDAHKGKTIMQNGEILEEHFKVLSKKQL